MVSRNNHGRDKTGVQTILAQLKEQIPDVVDLAIQIQQISAPTFAEERRATFVRQQFVERGLDSIYQDEMNNVYGCLVGKKGGVLTPVVITAHLDTVFPIDTDLSVRRETNIVHGPGIGDNSAGVAGLLWLIAQLVQLGGFDRDIWFVANVGEEGLGDLKGMRVVVDRFGPATYLVIEGGMLGSVVYQALGVKRFKLSIKGSGGHSWSNFGQPSAIHQLGRLIGKIDEINVPTSARSSYNVGIIEGGTSINTIASEASLWLDLRSEGGNELDHLVGQIRDLVNQFSELPGIKIEMEEIGDRPAGMIPVNSALVRLATRVLNQLGYHSLFDGAASTDANIPLSRGYPAICIGLARGYQAHRVDEYWDYSQLESGLSQLLLLSVAVSKAEFIALETS